ncbi:5'-nucleotidase (lipoprotein e(P4) family) [Sphingomonas sp. UYAg733]
MVAAALALSGCVTAQTPPTGLDLKGGSYLIVDNSTPTVPATMQYLYGSGEGAAISAQAWRALVNYVGSEARGDSANSAVLARDATLAAPRWIPCGTKPRAAVFDVDETVLLNLGFEYNDAARPAPYDEARWQAWEKTGATQVAAVPGAVEALNDLRKMGVTVVFNSNRSAGNAAQTAAAITGAGLGSAVHGETLFLAGDDATGSKKDGRRATIAAKYCVVAMGGDQLGDFSDLFNAGLAPAPRRAAVMSGAISAKWGAGWFVLPNPVYGSALKGGFEDVFPLEKRWSPPASSQEAK